MNSSEKQNAKKNLNVKKSKEKPSPVPAIQSFFKSAPKSFVVDKTNVSVKPTNGDRQFYVDLLKSKLESYEDDKNSATVNDTHEAAGQERTDSNQNIEKKHPSEAEMHNSKNLGECTGCIQKTAERDDWERKYQKELEKRKEIKKVYLNLNVQFTELYMKYQSVLNAKGNIRDFVQCESSDGAAMVSEATVRAVTDNDATFTESQLKFLQFMALDKKNDCTFILQCLKYAYNSDPTVLTSKTLKGTAERTEITADGIKIHHEAKEPLTPEKVDRIKSLFMNRISKCEINSAEYVERMKDAYMNRLFAAGIGNLSKKPK